MVDSGMAPGRSPCNGWICAITIESFGRLHATAARRLKMQRERVGRYNELGVSGAR